MRRSGLAVWRAPSTSHRAGFGTVHSPRTVTALTVDHMDERDETYEGRPLPRPDDEVVDQGLGFDLGTLLSRRHIAAVPRARRRRGRARGLRHAQRRLAPRRRRPPSSGRHGRGGCGRRDPRRDRRPYPGDGSNGPDVLEQSGIVRSDIRSSFGDCERHRRGRADDARADHHGPRERRRPSPASPSTSGTATREGGYSMYSPGRRGPELPARRPDRGRRREGRATPASSRPATTGAGRTSTSRSTRTRRASPTPATRSPPRRWRCRRTPARRSTRSAGYEASVRQPGPGQPGQRQRLRRRRRAPASSPP